MAKVLLVTSNMDLVDKYQEFLQKNSFEFLFSDDKILTYDMMKSFLPDVVLLDYNSSDLDIVGINKDVKFFDNVITILLMPNKDVEPELMKNCNAFITEPFSNELLLSTINANLKTKKSFEKLLASNQDLVKSFYQLKVLHDISTQFAGTLDRESLVDIMIDGLDKTLNFGLACILSFKNEKEPVLIISSVYNINDRLLEALKLRATLNYKSIFDSNNIPFNLDVNTLKVEKRIKQTTKEYDFSILRADNIFAQISISENFYGFIEIFRDVEFTTEDSTCFHSIIQQLSLPLKSAMLYEKQQETNEELKKMERLKSDFISIVSHELKTPLTNMKSPLDIILSGRTGELNESTLKFINMFRRNVERLILIVKDLLDLQKIEAGKMEYKFENIKINQVVEEVKNNLDGAAKDKKIDLVTTLEDNFADIYADMDRLVQVLNNLVSNALKFTNENGKIEIRTKVVDASEIYPVEEFDDVLSRLKGKYLQVLVKDNGIGIKRENLNRIFDKFAQIEDSIRRNVGGTGLGLPIVKQLIEAHNGGIWCNSKPEKGSSFYFAIPVANDKTRFLINFKQNLKNAKINNKNISLITVQADKNILDDLISNVINSDYLKESAIDNDGDKSTLYLSLEDGNSAFVKFLQEKISEYANVHYGENCGIIYGYGIYPKDALDDFDLIKRLNKVSI